MTSDILGPSRAACTTTLGNEVIEEGEIIDPPSNAASVTIENLKVKNVVVANKEPNPFRNGFWDITLKYIFVYSLVFREADNTLIGNVTATSVFTKKITLFGSVGTDITISTDLFHNSCSGSSFDLNSDPFILVEAKAVALSAEMAGCGCGCCDCDNNCGINNQVFVTIGLFTIIKLFRIVNLSVQSKGFCIPGECEETSALNPCDYFDNLDFPMDIFAPPQKTEFLAGISSNIPNNNNNNSSNSNNNCGCSNNSTNNSNCGCGCGCGCGCSR